MPLTCRCDSLVLAICCLILVPTGAAADWPMWRYDARRSAATPLELPGQLRVQWTRELGTPAPAWPQEQDYHGKLEFDRTYQPIVLGNRIIVPSMAADRVTAYDTQTGNEQWRFYADGPVRFAPVGEEGKVYFTSDDSHLYCLNAEDGTLLWKVRGGPTDRAILGNERLTSSWPARGAPVLADGTVYFGAGIWPFMGIFIHAVDAETGEIEWTNSGTGAVYNLHQHGGALAFGGVAPQGYMAVKGDRLVVSGGLSVPAIFDRGTGEMLFYEQSNTPAGGKGAGGFDVATVGDLYFNNGRVYSLIDGTIRKSLDAPLPLLADDEIISLSKNELVRFSPQLDSKEVEVEDRRGRKRKETRYSLREISKSKLPAKVDRLLLQAGSRIFVTLEDGSIAALEVSGKEGALAGVWRQEVPGTVDHLLAADDKLFAVTEEGLLICFGSRSVRPRQLRLPNERQLRARSGSRDQWTETASSLLEQTGKTHGVALVWGLESGRLVEELVAQSELHVIALDPDEERVNALRERLDELQVYGQRAHVLASAPDRYPFPPYLAELVVSERLEGAGWTAAADDQQRQQFLKRLFHTLRPYGGIACLPIPEAVQSAFSTQVQAADLPNGETGRQGEFATLARVGKLPGAGQWTHQYASSANNVFSGDKLVKAPLGLLWFGGPSNHYALPRHAQGPVPQVAGGRLIIEGVNWISARCVYTGRTIWKREFPSIGFPYKASNHAFTGSMYIKNQPGANFIGSNYVSQPDGVYVVYEDECHRLDPETGDTVSTFRLPPSPGEREPAEWGYIGVWGDSLVAGASPHMFDDSRVGEKNWNRTSSARVVVMDRHTGDVLWSRDAAHGFRHNAIVPAGDKLFLIDRLSDQAVELASRRGLVTEDKPVLSAHDLQTGETLWSTDRNLFGTWLGYSEEHDVLIQAGRTGGREHLPDEPSERIIAYRGSDGEILWDEPYKYTGPLIIHGDQIISTGREDGSIDLLTGQERRRRHPITGEELPWTHTRTYGCGTILACENLLTFRSGAAGFFDFGRDGGTGNFGGFKAGCTPNLVPADGVLNAPDYTRTCTCSYQNQTSLAMVHAPEIETWTYSTLPAPGKGEPVQRIGINLGAPGDRQADDGTLWLEYPSIAGSSPDIPVKLEGDAERWFRNHSLLLSPGEEESAHRWVAASGLEGEVVLRLTLETGDDPKEKSYTIRLHFSEPDAVEAGERTFGITLQGTVADALDVVEAAGGRNRPVVREYRDVPVTDDLRVELHAGVDSLPPILSGIEILRTED